MAPKAEDYFRHKHLFAFLKLWDLDGDGLIGEEDFRILAQRYTILQRHGRLENDVLEKWQSVCSGWWKELATAVGCAADARITFEQWLQFFQRLQSSTAKPSELPDFLKAHLRVLFTVVDANKDGLVDARDYRFLLAQAGQRLGDVRRADECFQAMLALQLADDKNKDALTSDRFQELCYDFWTSAVPTSPGRYIMGAFDSWTLGELDALHQMALKRRS